MACKYYVNGAFSELYTDLFGYLDNTPGASKKTNDVYRILKKHKLATIKDKVIYLNQSNWQRALREVKRINLTHPGLLSTEYIRNTEQNIYSPAAELHSLTINESVLTQIEVNPPTPIEKNLKNRVDIDQYVKFVAGTDPNTRDYFLDEMARRENTSESRFSHMEREDLANVYRVSSHLKKSFASAGVTVEVELDTSIDGIGQVDPYQEGMSPVIRINPNLVTKDTTYHEFGHIYIDLLGTTDPTVVKAFEQLRGTKLFNDVKARYPELYGELLDKEVLATAIGIEGAKITRKNPNKLQRILNTIFRKIGKLFGINPNQAAILAQEMFARELRINTSLKSEASMPQLQKKSKDQEKLEVFIAKSKVRIEEELYRLKQKPKEERNQTEYATLLRLQAALVNAKKVEDLFKLVDALADTLLRGKAEFDTITSMRIEDQGQAEVLNRIFALNRTVDTLSELENIRTLLSLAKTSDRIKDQEQFDTMDQKLSVIIDQSIRLNADFREKIIPLWAQFAIGFTNKDISPAVQDIISTMERTKKPFSPPRNSNDWIELKRRFKDGQITKEELKEKQLALTIDHWKRKDIKGYADLVGILQDATIDKSAMSYWVDPLQYSSDRGVQLMIKMVDQANIEKNDMMLDLKSKLDPEYKAFAEGRDETNVAELNEPLIETVTLKGKERLAFVNPYDIKKHRENQKEYLNQIAKTYNKPKAEDYIIDGEIDQETFSQALNVFYSSNSGASYKRAEAAWNKKNTSEVPNWRDKLSELTSEIKEQNKIRRELKSENKENTEAYVLAGIYKAEREKEIRRNYIEEYDQPKGDWVRPSTGETYTLKGKTYTKTDYTNSKYTTIQNTPRLKKYYDFLLGEYRKQQKLVGTEVQDKHSWEEFSYLLPSWRKETIDRMREQGIIVTTKDIVNEGLTIQEADYDFYRQNENVKFVDKQVPVYGIDNVDAKDVSRDLGSSIYRFGHQAFNFKTKNEIHGAVATYQMMLKDREYLELNSAGVATFSWIANKFGYDLPDIKEGESYTYKHVTEWLDSIMFGQKNIKQTFTVRGKEFEANKIAGSLTAFTAASTLSFNALQATNQFTLDNMTLIQEGFAGQFMTKSDIAWAKQQYWGSGMAVTDIARFNPRSKIGKAIEYFDALTEFTDREGNRLVGGDVRKAIDTSNLLIMQQGVEHELSATRMLALMKNLEGKLKDKDGNVIMNKDGSAANLYDLLIIDKKSGKMSIDPRVDNFNRRDFMSRIQGLARRTNQTKGEMAHTVLSRRWIGKLVGVFRGWMVPGYRRRYGHGSLTRDYDRAQVDEELGTVTQGMYISFWNYIIDSFEKMSARAAYQDLNLVEQQNIKRSLVEFGQLGLASVLVSLLLNIDDDDETWATNFLLYQAKRYQSETLQWTPIFGANEVLRLIKSPTATVSPFTKGLTLLKQIAYEGGYKLGITPEEFIFYQRRSGKYAKGDRKIEKMFMDIFPVFRGLSKSGSPRDAYKWFTQGSI